MPRLLDENDKKELQDQIDNIEGATGEAGENGATFIPSVSADGVISWTNDKGLNNPNPVNIKGDKGEKGEKGDTGLAGSNGRDGEDGHTPVITVTPTTDGHWLAVDGEDVCYIPNGIDGVNSGIYSIERTSGNGSAGTTDTYTITYTDGLTSTFTVYNGKDGDPYVLTEADKQELVTMVLEALPVAEGASF